MDRSDVTGLAQRLRSLADRVEAAEHGEELVEVADELRLASEQVIAAFPVAAARSECR